MAASDDGGSPSKPRRGRPAIAPAKVFQHPNEMGRINAQGLRDMRLAWAYQVAIADGMTARDAAPAALANCKRRWGIECSVTTLRRAVKEFRPHGAIEQFIFELGVSPVGTEEIRVSIGPRRQPKPPRKPR